MKKYILSLLISIVLVSCFEEPEGIGFLSDDIYLKGADTIFMSMGGKDETDYAWLDESSQPCTFSIENVRDNAGNRSEQFFKNYTYRKWIKSYDFQTDTTEELVMAKLSDSEMPCFMINSVNGQLQYVETTSNLEKAGDVFHVDVRVSNSKGSKVYDDYAILKLTSETRAFTINEIINGINVIRNGSNNFVLYDKINDSQPDFIERRNNIYEDNGTEFARIHKISNEPEIGIKVIFRLVDSYGNLYNPAKYATYSSGTYSYIDHAINRQNTEEGMVLEFPTTPWPVNTNLRSYLKGPTANDFTGLDMETMATDFKAGNVPSLISADNWPDNNWADATAWYVRIRSIITFYESGTWEVTCKIPYTDMTGNFN